MNRFSAYPQLTPAAVRIVEHCCLLAGQLESADAWAGHLILTLLLDESLASASLQRSGVDMAWLIAGGLGSEVATSAVSTQAAAGNTAGNVTVDSSELPTAAVTQEISSISIQQAPEEFTRILERAAALCRHSPADDGISSWHLLVAVIEINQFVCDRLRLAGAVPAVMQQDPEANPDVSLPPLPADFVLRSDEQQALNVVDGDLSDDDIQQLSQSPCLVNDREKSDSIWRIVDANLNRAREGLRVLEDYARFVRNHSQLSGNLKLLRHSLADAERNLIVSTAAPAAARFRIRLASRNTQGDVGTGITTAAEQTRQSIDDLVVANCRRVQEAFRSLEEFGKLLSRTFAAKMKQARYQSYELEQQLLQTVELNQRHRRIRRLQQSCLYALITESLLTIPWKRFVEQLLAGGVDILQLREKALPDRELICRAKWLVAACREAGALSIINDRADICLLSDADGLHVGQDEMTAEDARRIIGDQRLLGISTHQILQVQQAAAAGADYLGVGPVFPGHTKSFAEFPGLGFVNEVASAGLSIPWFAIGGISSLNLSDVVAAGASRIAVTGALSATATPSDSAAELRRILMCPESV